MRRRLRKFLPIVLTALVVQTLAPIAVCRATSIAASDPLHAALICQDNAARTRNPAGQTGGQAALDRACSLCCSVDAGSSLDTPHTAVAMPYRLPGRLPGAGAGSAVDFLTERYTRTVGAAAAAPIGALQPAGDSTGASRMTTMLGCRASSSASMLAFCGTLTKAQTADQQLPPATVQAQSQHRARFRARPLC
jgi:hypothetical protein